jgi:hypothetical protein
MNEQTNEEKSRIRNYKDEAIQEGIDWGTLGVRDAGVMQAAGGQEGFEGSHDAEPRRRVPSVEAGAPYETLGLSAIQFRGRTWGCTCGCHHCGTSRSDSTKISSSLTKTSLFPHHDNSQQPQHYIGTDLRAVDEIMAGVAEKAKFFLERSVPQLREWEEKELFSKVRTHDRAFASPCH